MEEVTRRRPFWSGQCHPTRRGACATVSSLAFVIAIILLAFLAFGEEDDTGTLRLVSVYITSITHQYAPSMELTIPWNSTLQVSLTIVHHQWNSPSPETVHYTYHPTLCTINGTHHHLEQYITRITHHYALSMELTITWNSTLQVSLTIMHYQWNSPSPGTVHYKYHSPLCTINGTHHPLKQYITRITQHYAPSMELTIPWNSTLQVFTHHYAPSMELTIPWNSTLQVSLTIMHLQWNSPSPGTIHYTYHPTLCTINGTHHPLKQYITSITHHYALSMELTITWNNTLHVSLTIMHHQCNSPSPGTIHYKYHSPLCTINGTHHPLEQYITSITHHYAPSMELTITWNNTLQSYVRRHYSMGGWVRASQTTFDTSRLSEQGFGTSVAPSRVNDVITKPLDKRIAGTEKSVVEGLRQIPEVVLNGRHIQVAVQSHIPNIPRCVHNDPQTHALERLHPPHIRVRQVAPSGTRIVEDRSEQLLVQCQTVPSRQGATPVKQWA
uniref:Uncharacterized protein n=1 Tax=Timema bartmani TaxID=61472 RepID=A0A7R9F833_9NEOP|nr:unnamed protein product [Timema bartmani]